MEGSVDDHVSAEQYTLRVSEELMLIPIYLVSICLLTNTRPPHPTSRDLSKTPYVPLLSKEPVCIPCCTLTLQRRALFV